jgi:hypothetical protein
MDFILPGLYQHHKGGRYRVLFTATDSETLEPVVIYVSLTTSEIFARPEKMWNQPVTWPDGSTGLRFAPIKPELARRPSTG